MKILVLDNYDSFTYNLVAYVEHLTGVEPEVRRNDRISLSEVAAFDKILLSPGPGLPSESGILCDVIRSFSGTKSILGVCLGLQAITEVFGGSLENLPEVFHGVATPVHVLEPENLLFAGLPKTFTAGRYHSWVASKKDFPDCLRLTAVDDEERVMALSHNTLDVHGVQFHPESVMTEHGMAILKNWLKMV